ncbi:hypothetical protein [Desulfurobacterium sp.]|uniref:hypothetical protein n=1 Tax=Desulfurobacterium sp. TaxID=2004706 RepID=UPI0026213C2F|nr:hypothetical protein [Desulfurobacterium sp.]
MSAVNIIEKILNERHDCEIGNFECCIVCSSRLLSCKLFSFPSCAFTVANAGCQAATNLASIYYAVKTYNLPLIGVIETNGISVKDLIGMNFPAAEVEFKVLSKVYEENFEILAPLYESEELLNTAFIELNIDAQVDVIKNVPEFEKLFEEKGLLICGFVFDEACVYGEKPGFYLTNCNGLKDPEAIRQLDFMENLPEPLLKEKVNRLHIQM